MMEARLKLDLARLALDAAARTVINAAKTEAVAVARDVEQASRDWAWELMGELVESHAPRDHRQQRRPAHHRCERRHRDYPDEMTRLRSADARRDDTPPGKRFNLLG